MKTEAPTMLSETLTAGLEAYRIGPKIRALRVGKKLGLVQLGEHTGLSPAMLSKIERGQVFPTLPTLLRIALVFGVGLDHFFVERRERPMVAVTRKAERLRLPDRPGGSNPSHYFESLDYPATDRKLDAYQATFPAGAEGSAPHRHEGAEFVFVLEGRLAITVGEEETVLEAGDSMYFDCNVPHSYRNDGKTSAAAVHVIAP